MEYRGHVHQYFLYPRFRLLTRGRDRSFLVCNHVSGIIQGSCGYPLPK